MKKKTVKLIVFLAVALVVFLGLSEAAKDSNRTSISSLKGIYTEPENSLDVVLIGASEIYAGYAPTEAWKEYGFTSYDYATAGIPGNLYKSMLKEVLREQDPKLVVFEVNGFCYSDKYYTESSGNVHTYIDNMKISKNWAETIKEVIPEDEQSDYFFPISTYHDNWKHPKGSIKSVVAKTLIKVNNRSNLKGYATFSGTRKSKKLKKDKGIQFTDLSRNYLNELCQLCQEEGVENVLFVRFPHLREPGNPNVYDEMGEVINSYGFDFLNLTDYTELELDKDKDFYNSDHMNYYGMKKFTTYFSDYLVSNYDLPAEHNEKVEEYWASCTEKADEIFRQCEEDFEKGEIRHYMEISCYHRPNLRKEVPER